MVCVADRGRYSSTRMVVGMLVWRSLLFPSDINCRLRVCHAGCMLHQVCTRDVCTFSGFLCASFVCVPAMHKVFFLAGEVRNVLTFLYTPKRFLYFRMYRYRSVSKIRGLFWCEYFSRNGPSLFQDGVVYTSYQVRPGIYLFCFCFCVLFSRCVLVCWFVGLFWFVSLLFRFQFLFFWFILL